MLRLTKRQHKPYSGLYPWITSMADIPEIVQLSQAVCTGLSQPYILGNIFRCFLCYTATVPPMNLYVMLEELKKTSYKFHQCSPQYYTKSVVDIGPQNSDYPVKFLQYRLWGVFTAGESKMTNVTVSHSITAYRSITNTQSSAIKRVQKLCNLKIYSSEEPKETVRW